MGLLTNLKQGIGLIKNKVKKAGKWMYANRKGIGKAIGAGLDIASDFGVPYANVVNKAVKGIASKFDGEFANGIKSSSNKKKPMIKQDSNESENSYQQSTPGYSLMPRKNFGTKESRSWRF